MSNLTDKELLEEVAKRFHDNKKALVDIKKMTQKLADVNIKLITSEKMKSNFLSNIRNEINNPLSSILGVSEILIHNPRLPEEESQALLKTINSEAFNLNKQLQNIFLAAELEAGETYLSSSLVNMRHLLLSIIDDFTQIASEKNISLNLIADIEDHSLYENYLDPEKFQMAISNVVANAIEFASNDSEVVISLAIKDEIFFITIKDFGIGIDDSKYKKIFDRFYQIDSGREKKYLGHGLGLSITKEIVELMGGSISVESNNKDEWAIFSIIIPKTEGTSIDSQFSEESNEFIFDSDFTFEDDGEVF